MQTWVDLHSSRQFTDTNGDMAFLAIPILIAALKIPLDSTAMLSMATCITSFAAVGLMTNQIHQWAHMRRAPWPITGIHPRADEVQFTAALSQDKGQA